MNTLRCLLVVAFVLAARCGGAGSSATKIETAALERVDTTASEPSTPACDGAEASLEVHWEASLEEAMERGRAEHKPVLIAFSARRQERDFELEF